MGCVLVYENKIIGRGMNDTNRSMNGTRHAEFIALNDYISQQNYFETEDDEREKKQLEVCTDNTDYPRQTNMHSSKILSECTLYVTVEPCIMCASLLRQIGIKRVFFGAWNDKFGGTGGVLDVHKREKVTSNSNEPNGDYEVSGGWLLEEAILLLRRFYVLENKKAPEPRDKSKRKLNLVVDVTTTAKGET